MIYVERAHLMNRNVDTMDVMLLFLFLRLQKLHFFFLLFKHGFTASHITSSRLRINSRKTTTNANLPFQKKKNANALTAKAKAFVIFSIKRNIYGCAF